MTRAGEDHVLLVAQGDLLALNGFIGLFHRFALTGEGALIYLKRPAVQQTAVGHHKVTGLQLDDIAGDDLIAGNLQALTVTQYLGGGGAHRFQAFQGLFSLKILYGAQNGVHNEHGENNQGTFYVAGEHGDEGGCNQNSHQQVFELLGKDSQHALFLALGQLVVAVLSQALGGLGTGETV